NAACFGHSHLDARNRDLRRTVGYLPLHFTKLRCSEIQSRSTIDGTESSRSASSLPERLSGPRTCLSAGKTTSTLWHRVATGQHLHVGRHSFDQRIPPDRAR